MAEWWELGLADPFGTLAPQHPRQRNLLDGATRSLRTDGKIVPGSEPGKIGPPLPPHPLSAMGLLGSAYGLSPFAAGIDLADAYKAASSAGTFGELLPALGPGAMAALGAVPGARAPAKAGSLAMDEASRLARADAMGFRREMPIAIGRTTEGEQLATRPIEVYGGRIVAAPQAAVRLGDGRTFVASNHMEAMEAAEAALRRELDFDQDLGPLGMGFITTNDRYVPRREGMEIAQRTRQDRAVAAPAGGPVDEFRERYGIRSEDVTAAAQPPQNSTVPIATTESGLPGGEGIWGRLLSDHLRWPQGGTSSHRMPATAASPTSYSGRDVAWSRATNPTERDVLGLDEAAVASRLKSAWANGHDAVMLKNYTRPGGKTPETVIVVKDPSQLRTPDARFDPAKKSSRDLLAGIAGFGLPAVTFGALISPPDEERY